MIDGSGNRTHDIAITISYAKMVVDELLQKGIKIKAYDLHASGKDDDDLYLPRFTLVAPPHPSVIQGEFCSVEQKDGSFITTWWAYLHRCALFWEEVNPKAKAKQEAA